MTAWTDDDSRQLTIAMVAIDGHHIPLRGDERAEAIRVMVARGLDTTTIADRLRMDPESMRRWANAHGITIPPAHPQQHWWVAVACPSHTNAARRRREQSRRTRTTTTTARSHP